MKEETQQANPFGVTKPTDHMTAVASSRHAQEVQAAVVLAKKFPRDEAQAYERIMKACKRKTLAEVACYAYPRGGTTVTGPSIRLAETLAQNWGNLDFGVMELEQENGESKVMAYAWDLETNVRQQKVFTVKHERKAAGQINKLTDPRDIYEMVANQGARRLRACILGVIPGDIQDAALEQCDRTLASGNDKPLSDRIREMVVAFSEHAVTQQMIEKRLGHVLAATSEQELVGLRKIYVSIRDNMAGREAFFDLGAAAPQTSENGGELLKKKAGDAPQAAPANGAFNRDEVVAELREIVADAPSGVLKRVFAQMSKTLGTNVTAETWPTLMDANLIELKQLIQAG